MAMQTAATNLCAGIIVNLEKIFTRIKSKLHCMKSNFEMIFVAMKRTYFIKSTIPRNNT